MSKTLTAIKCATEELSLTNCAIVNPRDFDGIKDRHIEFTNVNLNNGTNKYIFTIKPDNSIPSGSIGFGAVQRKWANIAVDQRLVVTPVSFDLKNQSIGTLIIEIDFFSKKNTHTDPYDSDKMAIEFIQMFANQAFTIGQQV